MAYSPRDRVLAALRHEQPDRTPRDFWAEPPALQRLVAHVGYDDRDRLLDTLGVDIRHLDAPAPPDRQIGEGVFQNFWGERFVYRQTPWGPMREDISGRAGDVSPLMDTRTEVLPISGLTPTARRRNTRRSPQAKSPSELVLRRVAFPSPIRYSDSADENCPCQQY